MNLKSILKNFYNNIVVAKLYLIIPILCIFLLALYNVINLNFGLLDIDFEYFYGYGRQVYSNPSDLYNINLRNYYLPVV